MKQQHLHILDSESYFFLKRHKSGNIVKEKVDRSSGLH